MTFVSIWCLHMRARSQIRLIIQAISTRLHLTLIHSPVKLKIQWLSALIIETETAGPKEEGLRVGAQQHTGSIGTLISLMFPALTAQLYLCKERWCHRSDVHNPKRWQRRNLQYSVSMERQRRHLQYSLSSKRSWQRRHRDFVLQRRRHLSRAHHRAPIGWRRRDHHRILSS